MRVDEVIERARRMLDTPVWYWLAKGGRFDAGDDAAPPTQLIHVPTELNTLTPAKLAQYRAKAEAAGITEIPTERVPACDCSNFSNWVMRIPHGRPDWMNTREMAKDATGERAVFERIDEARLGALLVFPPPPGEDVGHVGIVASLANGAVEVVHCSAQNFLSPRRHAIQVTGTEEFDGKPNLMWIWCRRVER